MLRIQPRLGVLTELYPAGGRRNIGTAALVHLELIRPRLSISLGSEASLGRLTVIRRRAPVDAPTAAGMSRAKAMQKTAPQQTRGRHDRLQPAPPRSHPRRHRHIERRRPLREPGRKWRPVGPTYKPHAAAAAATCARSAAATYERRKPVIKPNLIPAVARLEPARKQRRMQRITQQRLVKAWKRQAERGQK